MKEDVEPKIIDPEDAETWSNLYQIFMHEFDTDGSWVFASDAQSALDELVDYLTKAGTHEGLFYTREETDAMTDQERENCTYAGNNDRALNCGDYVRIIDMTDTELATLIKRDIKNEETRKEGEAKRKAIIDEYKVNEHGRITSPGKFEGEMLYAVYFYDAMLDGGSDETWSDGSDLFEITDEDRAIFPELEKDDKYILLEYRSDGFVMCSTHEEKIEDEGQEDDTDDEEKDEQPYEEDGFITDRVRGGYDVSFAAKFLGHFTERDEAEQALKDEIERSGFSPNCWFIDDHGGHTLISVLPDGMYWTQPKDAE